MEKYKKMELVIKRLRKELNYKADFSNLWTEHNAKRKLGLLKRRMVDGKTMTEERYILKINKMSLKELMNELNDLKQP